MPNLKTTAAVLVLVLLAGGFGQGRACAGTDLDEALRALATEKDPKARLPHVRRLAADGSARAVAALARLATSDPGVSVRAAAVTALGTCKNPKTDKLLVSVLRYGGPLGVRRATALSLGVRPEGVAAIVSVLEDQGAPRLQRGLAVRALGHLRDRKSFLIVQAQATSVESLVQSDAIRALALREDARKDRLTTFVRMLHKTRDRETLLVLLDAASGFPHPTMRPAVKRLTTYLEPAVQDAAQDLLDRIRDRQERPAAPALAPEGAGGRYAKPEPTHPPVETPPPDPGPRGRYDLVYVLDVTGSAHQHLSVLRSRILREFELLEEMGSSVRVGVIAFRSRREKRRAEDVLPLTYDIGRLRRFLDRIEAGGVDDRGAAIGDALHEALDTMGWRRGARRRVMLFADTGLADPRLAKRIVAIHFQADRTRTRVAYVLRTRTVVPKELEALAMCGGTRYVELLK